MTTRPAPPRPRPAAAVTGVRVLAVLPVLVLAWQFGTAVGALTGRGPSPHGTGAIVLHVVTGLLAVALLGLRARAGGPLWPAVLAALVFAGTFVQAAYGTAPGLAVHLPGALVITAGSVWLAAWSVLRLR